MLQQLSTLFSRACPNFLLMEKHLQWMSLREAEIQLTGILHLGLKKNTMLFWIPQNSVESGHLYWHNIIWKTPLTFWHTQHIYQTCSLLYCVNHPTSENINWYSKANQFIANQGNQGKNCYLVTPFTYSCVIMDCEKVQYGVLSERYLFIF